VSVPTSFEVDIRYADTVHACVMWYSDGLLCMCTLLNSHCEHCEWCICVWVSY